MKLSSDKAMEGEHIKNDLKTGLACEVVWATLCTLQKHVLRKSQGYSTA